MKNIFNSVKMTRVKRNMFDLTHDVKLSMDMGKLVPVCCLEAIPGDKFNIGCESLIRFSPLISPVMHRLDATVHYFFVPNRIVWPNWEKYITNTPNPTVLPAFPTMNVNTGNYTALHDYLGVPIPLAGESETISAIPFAAYQKIYNEYYRDQNLVTEVDDEVNDGNNVGTSLMPLRTRAWEHDYFTAALPWAQKGTPVSLPLGNTTVGLKAPPFSTSGLFKDLSGNPIASQDITTGAAGQTQAGTTPGVYDPVGSLQVTTTSTTINDMRRAFRLQEWLEKAARGGSRYVENIFAQFGVKSPDARLQRPEYITGVKSPITISETLNTTGTATAPQGNMSGNGIGVVHGRYGKYYVQEHGYIIGIMSVLPRTAYMQGLPKHFIKTTDPFEFYWPSFAHIGEQPVLNKELYAFQGAGGANTFGYVPRYAEYKYESNRVAGEFRSSLDFWHMARKFASAPALNQAFVEADPTTRVFAVQSPVAQKLYVHILHKISAVRGMPKYGNPQF